MQSNRPAEAAQQESEQLPPLSADDKQRPKHPFTLEEILAAKRQRRRSRPDNRPHQDAKRRDVAAPSLGHTANKASKSQPAVAGLDTLNSAK